MTKLKNNKKIKYYLLYTLIFTICCLAIFFIYYTNGKSFVYNRDGWQQYLKLLIYYSDYLKEIINNLIKNHTLIIPQWDFSIGEGSSIFSTFHLYVMGDPLYLLCVLFNAENMYIFYDACVLIRLFLAGVTFSCLCFYLKKDNYNAILAGSITYVFCFWNIFNANRHPHFLTPMVLIPLMIISVEKLIRNEDSHIFTVMVFVTAITNFYFFSLIVMLVVIYVVIRLLVLYKKDFKLIFKTVKNLFIYSIIGVLMAAIVVLPMLKALTGDDRLSESTTLHLIYPIYYYFKLPSIFLSTGREYWLCLGYASPVLLAILSSLIRRKDKLMIALNIVAVIFIVSPIFAQISNGFQYITNKWAVGLNLLFAYNLTNEWDYLKDNKKVISICFGFVFLVCLVAARHINIIVPLIICLLFLLLICLNTKKQYLLILLVVVCVCFNGIRYYSPWGSNYSETATTIEEDKNIMNVSEAKVIREYIENIEGNEFFRYSGNNLTTNASILFNTHSTSYYWSLSNKYVSNYRNSLEMNEYSLIEYDGYDNRSTLYTLANVKYYITDKGYSGLIPYNFEYYDTFEEYDLYINNTYLPFGYTYDKVISNDEWEKLNAIEKEEVLTQVAVVDDVENNSSYITDSKKLEYKIICNDGIVIEDNSIVVNDTNSSIRLEFDGKVNEENYFSISGLNYSDGKSWIKNPNTEAYIYLKTSNGVDKEIKTLTADDKYYYGRENFISYLGYSNNEKLSYIELSFSDKGTYSFDEISVISKSTNNYANNIELLKENVLENVEFSTDNIKAQIELDKEKYLVLSIPYSKDWIAYVDGEKVDTFVINGCYTGIKLDAGLHEIELKYTVPLIKIGAIVSAFSIISFISLIIVRKKRQNEK